MPCESAGCEEDLAREWRKKANSATRAACDMRTVLRRHKLEEELCLETRKWIARHDTEDASRVEEETRSGKRKAAREAALNKLTMDERRVLGL